MKKYYNIDMEKEQYPKIYKDIDEPDIIISMGCDVGCPYVGRPIDFDWGIEDPTGKDDEEFLNVIEKIKEKVLELK